MKSGVHKEVNFLKSNERGVLIRSRGLELYLVPESVWWKIVEKSITGVMSIRNPRVCNLPSITIKHLNIKCSSINYI